MDDFRSILVLFELFLNRRVKPTFFQWISEYYRDHPLASGNSNEFDPLALLDSSEVCKLLKCNRHYLYEQVDANKIKFSRKGKALRFRRKDVQEYIDKEFS